MCGCTGATRWARTARATLCASLLAGSIGLSGCALTTPTRAEVEPERAQATLTGEDLVREGVLTVAVDAEDAPQVMDGAEGGHTGYYIDIARAIAERQGLDIAVVSSTDTEDALSDGEADIYIGHSVSEDEDLVVTSPILDNASAVFGRVEGDGASLSADDLSGSVVAVQSGSASQDSLAKAGVAAKLKECSNVNACFDALESGEADYVACDATAGAYLARAYPGVGFVSCVSDATSFGIVLPEDASDVASQVGATFDELLEEGVIEALHRQWYGSLPLSLADTLLAGVSFNGADDEGESGAEGTGSSTSSSSQGAGTSSDLSISGDLNTLD